MNINEQLYHTILHGGNIQDMVPFIARFQQAYDYIQYKDNAQNALNDINNIMQESGFSEKLQISISLEDPRVLVIHEDAQSILPELNEFTSFSRQMTEERLVFEGRWPIMLMLVFSMCVHHASTYKENQPNYSMLGFALSHYLQQPEANQRIFEFFFAVSPMDVITAMAMRDSQPNDFIAYVQHNTKQSKEHLVQILFEYGNRTASMTPTI